MESTRLAPRGTSHQPRGRALRARSWERYGALGGIWFFVLTLVAEFVGGDGPEDDASAAEFVEYYTENATSIQVGEFIGIIAVIGILWWFGSLWRAMDRAEPDSNRAGVIALNGFLFGGVMITLAGLVDAAVAAGIDHVGEGALFFDELSRILFAASSIGFAVLAAAVSGLAWRTGFLPRWLAGAGFVVAALEVVASGGVATDSNFFGIVGFIGIILWGLWVVMISAQLYRRAPAAREALPAN